VRMTPRSASSSSTSRSRSAKRQYSHTARPVTFVGGGGSVLFHAPRIAYQANHEADQLS